MLARRDFLRPGLIPSLGAGGGRCTWRDPQPDCPITWAEHPRAGVPWIQGLRQPIGAGVFPESRRIAAQRRAPRQVRTLSARDVRSR
jgi:hypothetical protein